MNLNLSLHDADFNKAFDKYSCPSGKNFVDHILCLFHEYVRCAVERQLGLNPEQLIVSFQVSTGTTAKSIIENEELRAYRFGLYISFKLQKEKISVIIDDTVKPYLPKYEPGWQPIEWDVGFYSTKRLDKYSLKAPGIIIPASAFGFILDKIENCSCPLNILSPDMSSKNLRYYIIWICACCGKKYVCECFRGTPEIIANSFNHLHTLEKFTYRDNICHFCRDIPSAETYISDMYGGKICQHYYPYINSIAINNDMDRKDAENIIRDRLGVPRIGEGWVSQTHLFHTIRAIYSDYIVEREASPEWLDRQRFDIYLPELKIAVEYQGKQHFEGVEYFGGQEALQATQERDKLKKEKAKKNGAILIEFKYDEVLTEDIIVRRIDKAIAKQKKRILEI